MRVVVLKAEDKQVTLLLGQRLDNIIRFPRKPVMSTEESSASQSESLTASFNSAQGIALEQVLALWSKRAVFQLPADFTLESTLEIPSTTSLATSSATSSVSMEAELAAVLDALLAHCLLSLSVSKGGQGGRLQMRANLLHQPQQQELAYHGLSAGEYVLVLFSADGTGTKRNVPVLDENVIARVKAFGGEVSSSDQGELGLRVALHMPIVEIPRHDGGLELGLSNDNTQSTLRVLLVDDDKQTRDVVGALLRRLGCTVMAFADGSSALEALERDSRSFQLVLSDLTMPHMSGAEMARRIRQQHHRLPIAMMTGFARSLETSALEALGVFAVLEKPFGKNALRQLLDAAHEELSAEAESE